MKIDPEVETTAEKLDRLPLVIWHVTSFVGGIALESEVVAKTALGALRVHYTAMEQRGMEMINATRYEVKRAR